MEDDDVILWLVLVQIFSEATGQAHNKPISCIL
jgi:hypothetical protein